MRLVFGVGVFAAASLATFFLLNNIINAPTGVVVSGALLSGVLTEWLFYKAVKQKE